MADFRLFGVDFLPDSVGILLLFLAVRELRELDFEGISAFRILIPVLIALTVWEVIRISGQISGNFFWTTAAVGAILKIFFLRFFEKNVRWMLKTAGFSEKNEWPGYLGKVQEIACILCALISVFSLPDWIFAALSIPVSALLCSRILRVQKQLKPFFG